MKKILILFVLVTLFTGVVLAQEERAANVRNNWISGEASLFGVGARYEYMLNSQWSIGGNVYWNNLFLLWNELGIDVTARYYPWGKIFFVGMGLGYHGHSGTFDYDSIDSYGKKQTVTWFGTIYGVAITPEAGWKIDVGSEGGFFLQPGVKLPITLGALRRWGENNNEFRAGFGFVAYFGMGYAF